MKTRIISYLATGACTLAWALPCAADLDSKMPEAAELPLYQDAVKNGDARGMNMLGKCYMFGIGVKVDRSSAIDHFRQGAALGNLACRHNLALCLYDRGQYSEAAEAWKQNAAAGFANSEASLGRCYLTGVGVKADAAEAFRLLQSAHEHGCAYAARDLGVLYMGQHGILRNMNKALELFEEAEANGDEVARLYLCCMAYDNYKTKWEPEDGELTFEEMQIKRAAYLKKIGGKGTDSDPSLDDVVHIFKGIVEKHDPAAIKAWCRCWQDYALLNDEPAKTAFRDDLLAWLPLFAEKDDAEAWCLRGKMLQENVVPEPLADVTAAAECFRRAAELGSTEAAFLYFRVCELQRNDKENALKWLQKAADAGNDYALVQLAVGYRDGSPFIAKDEAKAAEYFEKALDAGVSVCARPLAELCLKQANIRRACEAWTKAALLKKSPAAQQEFITQLTPYAEKGECAACVGLGRILLQQQKEETAAAWFLKAAEKGDAEGEAQYSRCCFYGWGMPQNLKEGEEWAKRAAEHGSPLGQSEYATALLHGDNGPTREAEGLQWYLKAAEQGYAKAQYEAGVCYLLGEGSARDVSAGVRWLEKAVQNGHPGAHAVLGELYLQGADVPQDKEKAYNLFEQSAERGSEKGLFLLGRCLLNGEACEQNIQKGLRLLSMAQKRGSSQAGQELARVIEALEKSDDPDVMFELATAQREGNGMPKNAQAGWKTMIAAANKGNARARYTLSQQLRRQGNKAELAAQLLKQAAEAGYTPALMAMAFTCMENGQRKEAARWFEKAAENGVGEACCRMAALYDAQNNRAAALPWHIKAAELGQPTPEFLLANHVAGMAYLFGDGVKQDYTKAAQYLSAAAELGDHVAQYNLGVMYWFGDLGLERNPEKAGHWLRLAACQGSKDAEQFLQEFDVP